MNSKNELACTSSTIIETHILKNTTSHDLEYESDNSEKEEERLFDNDYSDEDPHWNPNDSTDSSDSTEEVLPAESDVEEEKILSRKRKA